MENNSKIIIACLALLIIILGALFFEIKDLPDVQWAEKYDFEDKEPQGLYVFKEIVTRYYEGVDYKIQQKYQDTTAQNGLYIYGNNNFGESSLDSIISIINDNNDVFIFSSSFYRINQELEQNLSQNHQSSKKVNFQFLDHDLQMDSTFQYQFVDRALKFDNLKSYYLLEEGTTHPDFTYLDEFEDDEVQTDPDQEKKLKGYTIDKVTIANDSLYMFMKFQSNEGGSIYFHLLPELFFNHSYRQPQMFDYTTRLLSIFDPEYIVFVDKMATQEISPVEHPLQFIMSSPPLKAAYYLLLIGMVLYAIFGGKRRQKAIPIADKNENTSLEYIETVSQLFYQQNQHEKLVAHMKTIFFHKMEQKFYIKKENPDYLEILAKKSKLPIVELKYILDRFQNHDDHYKFKTEQLTTLHNRLEQIYSFIDNK